MFMFHNLLFFQETTVYENVSHEKGESLRIHNSLSQDSSSRDSLSPKNLSPRQFIPKTVYPWDSLSLATVYSQRQFIPKTVYAQDSLYLG